MTITWEMLASAVAGYALRELFGFVYREGQRAWWKLAVQEDKNLRLRSDDPQ